LAGALLRLMVIALSRDGVASGAGLAKWASQPLVPPRRAASQACARLLHIRCGPLGAARLDRRGLPVRSCRPPAIPAPGAVF